MTSKRAVEHGTTDARRDLLDGWRAGTEAR
jgi:hypothetical protein